MTRRLTFAWLLSYFAGPPKLHAAPPVEIFIGEHKDITFTFRQMGKESLISLLNSVMTPDEKAGGLAKVLKDAGEITMVMTTRKEKP